MEELKLERQALGAPERLIGLEADHAIAVVGEVLERIGQLVVGRLVGLVRGRARGNAPSAFRTGRLWLAHAPRSSARAGRQTVQSNRQQEHHDVATAYPSGTVVGSIRTWRLCAAASVRSPATTEARDIGFPPVALCRASGTSRVMAGRRGRTNKKTPPLRRGSFVVALIGRL